MGYLICSRYDTVWHVMNVAVDPDAAGSASPPRCWPSCSSASATRARGSRSRSASPTRPRSRSTSASASSPRAVGAATTRTTARTPLIMWRTPGRWPGASTTCPTPGRRRDPRDRDELRRHVRGRRHRATARSARTSSPRRACTTSTAASCPRSPPAITSSSPTPSSTTRCHRRRELDALDLVAVTQGPGLAGALLVGVATAKALAAGARTAAGPSTTCRATSPRTSCATAGGPFAPPFLGLVASGGHTLLARVEVHDRYTVLGTHARRRRRRGDRQGRAASRPPVPRRPRAERLAAEGDPGSFAFPTGEGVAGLDFSFSGVKTALLYAVRDLGEEEARSAARTSPPATSARSSRRSWPGARARLRATGLRSAWPSAAAWRPTARCARGSPGWAWSSTYPLGSSAPTTRR